MSGGSRDLGSPSSLPSWVQKEEEQKETERRRRNTSADDSYNAGSAQTEREGEEGRRRGGAGEKARDPRDTEAVISSLITRRNDCNESETEKWKTGENYQKRQRKKERSESGLIKMSAGL